MCRALTFDINWACIGPPFKRGMPRDFHQTLIMLNSKLRPLVVSVLPAAAIFSALPLQAFPPAPYHTVYGDVRDEYGVLLPADGASVVMSQGGGEKMREPLTAGSGADYNYQLRMRIDMGRSLTSAYSSLVVSTASGYTLTINIGGADYYPIEITARTPTVGTPASRIRLDLTLGG